MNELEPNTHNHHENNPNRVVDGMEHDTDVRFNSLGMSALRASGAAIGERRGYGGGQVTSAEEYQAVIDRNRELYKLFGMVNVDYHKEHPQLAKTPLIGKLGLEVKYRLAVRRLDKSKEAK